MNQIKLNNYTIELPGEWNELSKKQILYIAEYIPVWQLIADSTFSLGKAKALLLLKLLNISEKKIVIASHRFFGLFCSKKSRAIANVASFSNKEETECLLKLTDFIFRKNTLTHNKFQEIKIAGLKFYGPTNDGNNIRFGEFVFAEEYFKAYTISRNEKYLYKIATVLYRPHKEEFNPHSPKTDGDRRENFNRYNLDLREKIFLRIDKNLLNAIVLFYAGWREKMIADNPRVFNISKNKKAKQSAKSSPTNWGDILLKMARNKNIDDELLEQKILSTVLMELEQIEKENEEALAQMEANK